MGGLSQGGSGSSGDMAEGQGGAGGTSEAPAYLEPRQEARAEQGARSLSLGGAGRAWSFGGAGSVGSRTGAGSGADSVGSRTGAGSGADSVGFRTGEGSGADSERKKKTTKAHGQRSVRHERTGDCTLPQLD